eukprot:784656-Amphidinium_carterae.1
MTDVRSSTGATREKWVEAAQKELDTLLTSKTVSTITLTQREELKAKCRRTGGQYSELPCKGVFNIKPNKYKARICGCGNFDQDTYGSTATNEMDTCVMRYLLSWHTSHSSPHLPSSSTSSSKDEHVLSSLDFTG